MLTRRTTRSVTRANSGEFSFAFIINGASASSLLPAAAAAVATNDAALVPSPAPAVKTTPEVLSKTQPLKRTRSGRVLGQIVETAKRVTGGRKGRTAAPSQPSAAPSGNTRLADHLVQLALSQQPLMSP